MGDKWQTSLQSLSVPPDANLSQWLTQPQNMVNALRAHFQQVAISRFCQQLLTEASQLGAIWQAFINELSSGLGMQISATIPQQFWQRQVIIEADAMAVVYGHTIMPEASYLHFADRLDKIADQFLGESLLYCCEGYRRSPFLYRYAPLAQDNILNSSGHFYQRGSLFQVEGYPLLLVESLVAEALPYY